MLLVVRLSRAPIGVPLPVANAAAKPEEAIPVLIAELNKDVPIFLISLTMSGAEFKRPLNIWAESESTFSAFVFLVCRFLDGGGASSLGLVSIE